VKLVVQVKLLPTPEQAAALEATLRACNTAASDVAVVARETGTYRNYDLRKHVYAGIKDEYALGAQAAQHVIKKVADAYATRKANLKAGNYGKPGSKRRRSVETNPVGFRWNAAQPYDARMLSWQADASTVSIWTTHGRLRGVTYTGSADQLKAITTSKIGESDLVHRDGMWFLYASVEIPEPDLIDPDGFLGVDMGIANIAYDCDGTRYAGDKLNGYRRRQLRLRSRLQDKNTTSPPAAAGPTQQEGNAARRERQPPHRQDHRDRGCTHRPRHRRRGTDGDPRPGPAPQAPTGHTLLMVVPPARQLPDLQGPPGWCTAGPDRPAVHLPDLPRLRSPRQAEPTGPGNLHLSVVRGRCPRRSQCGPQHRPARRRELGRSQPPTRGITLHPVGD